MPRDATVWGPCLGYRFRVIGRRDVGHFPTNILVILFFQGAAVGSAGQIVARLVHVPDVRLLLVLCVAVEDEFGESRQVACVLMALVAVLGQQLGEGLVWAPNGRYPGPSLLGGWHL